VPSYIVERGGKFGARVPRRRGGWEWLGTRETRAEAEQLVAAARRPSTGGRRRSREVVPPLPEEIEALLAAAPHEAMRVFALVGAYSGLRLFEIAALRPRAIDLANGRITVEVGKGGYRDEVSLLYEPGLSALTEFMAGCRPDDLIWRTREGGAFSRQHVSRLWKGMRAAAGVGCTFHALRHFHACWLLDKGAKVDDVAAQLRHHDHGRLVNEVYGRYRSRQAALDRLDALR